MSCAADLIKFLIHIKNENFGREHPMTIHVKLVFNNKNFFYETTNMPEP
jgi:hypothetical protein